MAHYTDHIKNVAHDDAVGLLEARESYGDSWMSRGGVGAFMNLSRKWDRIEQACKKEGYDIFKVMSNDKRFESIMNDVSDLRRYLNLVESWARHNVGVHVDRDLVQAAMRKSMADDDGVDHSGER